jgi:hypothetical protein
MCCPLIILNFSRKRNFFLCRFSLDCDQIMSHIIATLVEHPYGRSETVGCIMCIMLGGLYTCMTHHLIDSIKINTCLPGGKRISESVEVQEENKFADVDLRGKLENYAPLEITGKINPLRDDLYVDLKIDFKNMDLSPVTPYSGRYLGYTIQKGELSLGLTI